MRVILSFDLNLQVTSTINIIYFYIWLSRLWSFLDYVGFVIWYYFIGGMSWGNTPNQGWNQQNQSWGQNPNSQDFNQQQPGFNQGFNQQPGFNQQQPGFNQGYNQPGFNQGGYNHGFNQQQPGFNQPNFNQPGFNQPPGFNQGFNQGPSWTTGYNFQNPFNMNIPQIPFTASCKKCHGTGITYLKKKKMNIPCRRCYRRQGYCRKCYGTGYNYIKNKPCKKCKGGRKGGSKKGKGKQWGNTNFYAVGGGFTSSSSSSDSDWSWYHKLLLLLGNSIFLSFLYYPFTSTLYYQLFLSSLSIFLSFSEGRKD